MKKFLKSIMMLTVAVVGASLAFAFAGCGESGPERIEGTEGLKYELSEDGTYYIMTDASECTEPDVIVGNWYDGKPVKAIGDMAFKFQEGLNSVTVAEGVTEYGECWLDNGTATRVVLPDGVKSMGTAAFLICFNLKEVVIGTGLETIEVDTFEKAGDNYNAPKEFTIYFRGTEAEWNEVEVAANNDLLEECTIVFNYTGD